MKFGRTFPNLISEIERQMATKLDMTVPTRLMRHETSDDGISMLSLEMPDGLKHFRVTENCRRQLAERLKIPFTYFERMRTDQPKLLDRNVNTWLHEEPEQRLVRTLDGAARAFLSDRYRRLDHFDLLKNVVPILKGLPGVRFESCDVTESNIYLKAVTDRVSFDLNPAVGDIVYAGVVIKNSETGQGSLSVQSLVYRLKCLNGLVAPDQGMRKAHIGRLAETSTDEVTVYRDDTLAADDTAFWMKVRDHVVSAVSEATFRVTAERMRETLGIKLTGDPVKAVETLAARYLLNEQERVGVLRELITEGDLSGFGLVNAVTHFAQHDSLSYERASELEVIGGKMLAQSKPEWAELAEAA